jgi:hydrogenase expression/formation protein HypE
LNLSIALIVEEGLPLQTLRRVVESIGEAARACRIPVVTGDTKVVPRGAADKLFISTTGVGRLRVGVDLGPHRIRPGDRVLVSGTIGDHGIAILMAREGFDLEADLGSDTAPLHELVQTLLALGDAVHFLRDPTRGGLSAVLHEVCEAAGVSVVLEESSIPLNPAVRGACEILGLDPLYVADEGKLLVITAPGATDEVLACLRRHPLGKSAALIGAVTDDRACEVFVRGVLGSMRVLDEPSGSPLPRIC